MKKVLADLVALLDLERIEENLYRGDSQDLGWHQLFGGQVLGQALSAAERTVPPERAAHSLHAYFLRRGDVSVPVVYQVDPIRDGRSFNTRRVVAIQHGKAILNLSASFQKDQPGLDHADPMPQAPEPDTLLSQQELGLRFGDALPPGARRIITADKPIEIRPVLPSDPMSPEPRPARRMAWFRAADALPDEPHLHRQLLAYASDFHFFTTALEPHGVSILTPGVQIASLDHAMWFHRPFRVDEWLLYEIDSPSASGSRGLVRGRFFDRAGRLVASTTQEGLVRTDPS
jgi:acyl-CoA thioesterase-2